MRDPLYLNQERKLRLLLKKAQNRSPFYQKRLAELNTETFLLQDLDSIPLLEKKDLIGKEKELLPLNYPHQQLHMELTSGSTGRPLICYKSNQELLLKQKDLWKLRMEYGDISSKDRYGMFYAFTEDTFNTKPINRVGNILYLSMLNMSAKTLYKYYHALMKFQPSWFLSPPSAMALFATYLLETGLEPKAIGLRYIELTGELLFDHQLRVIEEAFGKIVHNHYGCREFWCLGMTCKVGNLHINVDRFIFEVINIDKAGIGELVVTDLNNTTWPLIRYHLGDLVHQELTTCSCGKPLPVLKVTGGRTQEYVRIGEWVSNPILFHYCVMKLNHMEGDCIRQFRIIQVKEAVFDIFLVPGTCFNKSKEDLFVQEILQKLPKNAQINIRLVHTIEFTTHKFTYFVPYKQGNESK